MTLWLPMLALLAQASGVSMEGVRASASEITPQAFIQQGPITADEWLPVTGHVQIEASDRGGMPNATWGDTATVRASVNAAGRNWAIELDQPGFAPNRAGQGLRSY